jgi:hypothetical protein
MEDEEPRRDYCFSNSLERAMVRVERFCMKSRVLLSLAVRLECIALRWCCDMLWLDRERSATTSQGECSWTSFTEFNFSGVALLEVCRCPL